MSISPQPTRIRRPSEAVTACTIDMAPPRRFHPGNPPKRISPPEWIHDQEEFKRTVRFKPTIRLAAQVRIFSRNAIIGRHKIALDPQTNQSPASRETQMVHLSLLSYFDRIERGLEPGRPGPWRSVILMGLLLRIKILYASLSKGQRMIFEKIYGVRLNLLRYHIDLNHPFLRKFVP